MINSREIKNYLKWTIEIEETEQNTVKGKTKTEIIIKQYQVAKLLSMSRYTPHFAIFHGVKIISENPNYLSLWRAPTGEYLEGYSEKFIKIWCGRVTNPEAMMELSKSHGFRFEHLQAFIAKFFISFGPGKAGKSTLTEILNSMYGKHSPPAAKMRMLTQQFNAPLSDALMLQFEEADRKERATYNNTEIITGIKRSTNEKKERRNRRWR
jgi:hypothetical protein